LLDFLDAVSTTPQKNLPRMMKNHPKNTPYKDIRQALR
jgi:hypothetical protein